MTTIDPNCIFDETLHQDVKIAPNSSIALKNITLEADTSLTINGSNDNITYELTAGNPNVAYLTHRTYTNQDADGNALDKDITNALNRVVPLNGKGVGTQWLASIVNKSQLQIQFQQTPLSDFSAAPYDTTYTPDNIGGDAATGWTQGADATKPGLAYNKVPLGKGNGRWRMSLESAGTPTNGILFGLVDTHPGQQPPLTAADYQYGVHIRAPAANYQKIVAGVENDIDQNGNTLPAILEGTAVNHMDMIDVSIHQSNVTIEIHQCVNRADPTNPTSWTKSTAFSGPYNGDDLYPAFTMLDATAKIRAVQMTGDPYHIANTGVALPSAINAAPAPNQSTATSQFSLQFESAELASYLGFSQSRFPATGHTPITTSYLTTALYPMRTLMLADTFIVEMMSLELDSYDTSQNQRRNILAIVPQEQTTNSQLKQTIAYDTAHPLFINLRNRSSISIRNIRARVLREDYSPLSINGACVMTLLVK